MRAATFATCPPERGRPRRRRSGAGSLLELRAARIAGAQGLLDVVDVHARELLNVLERLLEAPVLVDVDLQRQVRDGADRANPLDVEAVGAAELELEPVEAAADRFGAAGHVVGVSEPDRPGRRRPGAFEAEQPPPEPEKLSAQVVRGRVDGCLGGLLARALGKPPSDRFERERVVADEVAGLVEERGRRLAVSPYSSCGCASP